MTQAEIKVVRGLLDELLDISPHKVRYRELARWSRTLGKLLKEDEHAESNSE